MARPEFVLRCESSEEDAGNRVPFRKDRWSVTLMFLPVGFPLDFSLNSTWVTHFAVLSRCAGSGMWHTPICVRAAIQDQ